MIKLPAIFDRYARKKDRSYSLTFISGLELTKSERESIDETWQQEGWLIFVPNEQGEVEIPKEKAEIDEKPRHVRLRNTLYVYWEQNKKDTWPSFDDFYKSKMDAWIEDIKEKLT